MLVPENDENMPPVEDDQSPTVAKKAKADPRLATLLYIILFLSFCNISFELVLC